MILFNFKNIFWCVPVLIFISCENKGSFANIKAIENDTAKIIKILLDSAFYRHNLPDISSLTRNNPFGDTIIFRNETSLGDTKKIARYFPKDLKLKFLTQSEICSLAIKMESDITYFPNFFEIRRFKKVDTAYEISLQITCVFSQIDKAGKRRFEKTGNEVIDTLPCIFGMLCGGGIGMIFTKKGDTLNSRVTGRWSD